MESLIAACALFLGMHWIVSGSPLRTPIVEALGPRLFQALFSLTIAISLVWMGFAYADAPYQPTWGTAQALQPLSLLLTLVAFLMFGLSITDKNPTTLGRVPPDQVEARGMVRITRHAGLLGLGLWGLAHFIVNGDWASHLLFGSIAFQGLIGPLNLDRKYRSRFGADWTPFARQTSYLPFVAIVQGRNRLVLGELNPWAAAITIAVFAALLAAHRSLFGVAPW